MHGCNCALFCAGSTFLYQTHPTTVYLCRSGNITLRCHFGVQNVLSVVWFIDNSVELDPSAISGHTALPRTTTYQEVVVDSYTNLREKYQCAAALRTGEDSTSNVYTRPSTEGSYIITLPYYTCVCISIHINFFSTIYIPTSQLNNMFCTSLTIQLSGAKVILTSLRFLNATTTTLSVTWSAGYPKCYSFTVSHSTQDGSINVTQPADSDTSHTLTSLQPGTTYRIEVEAVRKGDEADGQRAKVMGNFTTDTCRCEHVVSPV